MIINVSTPSSHRLRVLLDGVLVGGVFEVDTDRGEVGRYQLDRTAGKTRFVMLSDGEPVKEWVKGRVELEWHADAVHPHPPSSLAPVVTRTYWA